MPVTPTKYTRKPKLYIFGKEPCIPCEKFKRDAWGNADFKSKLTASYDVEFVDVEQNPELARRCQVTALPALVEVAGTAIKIIHVGFTTLRALHVAIWGDPDAATPEPTNTDHIQPIPALEPTPIEPDWSHVQIILCVPEGDVGGLRGRLRQAGISLAEGPLRRRISDATHGKAEFVLLSQRLEPDRFDAVTSAAGIHAGLHVLVLVKRQPLGLKGLIAGKIERSISDRLEAVPIEVIFERAHASDFTAIQDALAATYTQSVEPEPSPPTAEPTPPPTEGSLFSSLLGAVAALAGGAVSYAFGTKNKTKPVTSQVTET